MKELESDPQVVLDPNQAMDMRRKLLSQRKKFLEDLQRFARQGSVQNSSSSPANDFNPRFFASAMKDLRHAIAWFFELKERGL